MEFYADLSQYYEAIFPLSGDRMRFTESYIPPSGRILDIGCSTGELVIALAKDGYRAWGMDLSQEMIEKAQEAASKEGVHVEFEMGDMRELSSLFSEEYDGVLCYGNTIVHLNRMKELREFFAQVYALLKAGGVFLFQIVNYDRILQKKIQELPLIENAEKHLTFQRNYDYDPQSNLIHFNTRLVVDGQEIEHTVPLYPLTSEEIRMILVAEGFQEPLCFGDFAGHPYDPEHSGALVVAVRK